MECCAQKEISLPLKEIVCPSCKRKGKLVDYGTLVALVREEYKKQVRQSPYMFCETPNCDVVYYSENPDHKFGKAQVRVPVTAKDKGLNVPVCYCFGIIRQMILDDLQTKGNTTAFLKTSLKKSGRACARAR